MRARSGELLAIAVLLVATFPGAASAQDDCPPPDQSEIDQYVEPSVVLCPGGGAGPGGGGGANEGPGAGEGAGGGAVEGRLPYTGLSVVGLVMVGTLLLMAGLAIRRHARRTE